MRWPSSRRFFSGFNAAAPPVESPTVPASQHRFPRAHSTSRRSRTTTSAVVILFRSMPRVWHGGRWASVRQIRYPASENINDQESNVGFNLCIPDLILNKNPAVGRVLIEKSDPLDFNPVSPSCSGGLSSSRSSTTSRMMSLTSRKILPNTFKHNPDTYRSILLITASLSFTRCGNKNITDQEKIS